MNGSIHHFVIIALVQTGLFVSRVLGVAASNRTAGQLGHSNLGARLFFINYARITPSYMLGLAITVPIAIEAVLGPWLPLGRPTM